MEYSIMSLSIIFIDTVMNFPFAGIAGKLTMVKELLMLSKALWESDFPISRHYALLLC